MKKFLLFLLVAGLFVACVTKSSDKGDDKYSVEAELYADSMMHELNKKLEKDKILGDGDANAWNVTEKIDEMTDSKNYWAKQVSDNSFELDFPYSTSYCYITIRYMKKYGDDVLVSLTSGQIYGNKYRDDNYVLVRFDSENPIKYYFNEPADASSDCVFIRNKGDFIERCKKATDIKIEVPIYQNGRPIFKFHVEKPLEWPLKQ